MDAAPPPAADACLAALRAWRAALPAPADADAFLSDATLSRYAVAHRHDAAAAARGLAATRAWRSVALARPLGCAACAADATAHAFFPLGADDAGNAVVFGAPAWATSAAVEPTVAHVVQTLEHAWGLLPGAQWTWIVSFAGFGLAHALQARLGAAFASVFAQHHPERLRHLILLDPPAVFELLLTAVRPFADARTLAKVAVARGDARAALRAAGVGEAAAAWAAAAHAAGARPARLPPGAARLQLPDSPLAGEEEGEGGAPGAPDAGLAKEGGAEAAAAGESGATSQ